MEKRYHEIRTLSWSDLRNLCVRRNWFTAGSPKDYEKMLDKANNTENITTSDVISIAMEILNNSELDSDYSKKDNFENICFELFAACRTFIRED